MPRRRTAGQLQFDYTELKKKIKKKYGRTKDLARELGISSVSLSKKLNNHCEFTQSEIMLSAIVLDLSLGDMEACFFTARS